MEQLDALPCLKNLAGKVTVSLEFNCRSDGTLGSVHIETQVREELLKV